MHSPTERNPENAILENKDIELTCKLKSSAWFPSEVISSDQCVSSKMQIFLLYRPLQSQQLSRGPLEITQMSL